MAFKLVILAAFVAVAHAGVIGYEPHQPQHYSDAIAVSYSSVSAPVAAYHAAPAIKYAAPAIKYSAPAIKYAAPLVKYAVPATYMSSKHEEEQYAPAHYEFGYSVHDPHTGDFKDQHETREGDNVKGSYSFVEADGTKRIVEYTADKHNGFNAVVHREGTPVIKAAVPTIDKYSAPVVAKYSAPVVAKYSAPVVAKYSAPVAYAAPVAKFAYAAPSHGHYYH